MSSRTTLLFIEVVYLCKNYNFLNKRRLRIELYLEVKQLGTLTHAKYDQKVWSIIWKE